MKSKNINIDRYLDKVTTGILDGDLAAFWTTILPAAALHYHSARSCRMLSLDTLKCSDSMDVWLRISILLMIALWFGGTTAAYAALSDLSLDAISAGAAVRSAEASHMQAVWSIVQGFASIITLVFLLWSLKWTRDSVRSSESSNDLIRLSIVLENRAWMVTQVETINGVVVPNGDDEFNSMNSISIDLVMHHQNIGKTPAIDTSTNVSLFNDWTRAKDIVNCLIDEDKKKFQDQGRLVLPAERYDRPWYVSVPYEGAKTDTNGMFYDLVLVVVISYNIIEDKDRHHTALVYVVEMDSEIVVHEDINRCRRFDARGVKFVSFPGSLAT